MKDEIRHAITDFVFIDDDPVNNLICRLTVEIVLKGIPSESFVNPKLALDHFKTSSLTRSDDRTVLLLDINMPFMNGWEFLENFDNLPAQTKQQVHIYILSSSVDHRDKDRSYANKNVSGFLTKPLSMESIEKFAEDWTVKAS
jgi:CheY-like chemotaxis protein